MREIKFRLRDKDNIIVGYEKWYKGSWKEEEPEAYPNVSRFVASPCWWYSRDGIDWKPLYIPHRYKDQFTGLLDKNGKEIYEGDIVKFQYKDDDGEPTETTVIGVIEWFEPGARFLSRNLPQEDIASHNTLREDMEVIGDIHENQELLN